MKNLGGLVNELELRIKASDELLELYNNNCIVLEIQNNRYNQIYNLTCDLEWLKQTFQSQLSNINVLELRQSLIEKICYNNDLIEKYKRDFLNQSSVNSFIKKIYFFINHNKNKKIKNKIIKNDN